VSAIPEEIVFDSPELAALHEAGHVSLAIACGARVVEVELYREAPRSRGRTRVERTEEQRFTIAVGGLAAEIRLYQARRLRRTDGSEPTEAEFVRYALGTNAADDKVRFYGTDLTGKDGCWPEEKDRAFRDFAFRKAKELDWPQVERVAAQLLSVGFMDEAQVLDALGLPH